MTREERTELIKHLKYNRSIGADYIITDKDADEIIKALDQEPCEDAISRKAIKYEYKRRLEDALKDDTKGLDLTEFVDCTAFNEFVDSIPPVILQPKTGYWINRSGDDVTDENVECSACGKWRWGKTNYCPKCGAEMIETQESEE